MAFLEKDLESLIFENLQDPDGCELLGHKGFYHNGHVEKVL